MIMVAQVGGCSLPSTDTQIVAHSMLISAVYSVNFNAAAVNAWISVTILSSCFVYYSCRCCAYSESSFEGSTWRVGGLSK